MTDRPKAVDLEQFGLIQDSRTFEISVSDSRLVLAPETPIQIVRFSLPPILSDLKATREERDAAREALKSTIKHGTFTTQCGDEARSWIACSTCGQTIDYAAGQQLVNHNPECEYQKARALLAKLEGPK